MLMPYFSALTCRGCLRIFCGYAACQGMLYHNKGSQPIET
jgi:hypothetical protein